MQFEELNLKNTTLEQIRRQGFKEPTTIQEKCIPAIKSGNDVVGHSVTGSGKTFAFAIPIIESLSPGQPLTALVLTPTRELAEQVKDAFDVFGKNTGVKTTAVYGGVALEPQVEHMRKAQVLVATPGRLLDHMSRRSVDLRNIKFLVLDEVDKMLDMGFIEDVEKIMKNIPQQRQTLLFSATMTDKISTMIRKYLKDPVSIKAQTYVDKSLLQQRYYVIDQNQKFSLLIHMLKNKPEGGLAMIFCGTRSQVDVITMNLQRNKIKAMAIHGGLTQNKRLHALESLKKEHINVLVATDVAARGLDIKNVTQVYNYDVPKTPEEYIHRIGRTARAGKNGEAITLLTQKDYDNFRRVLTDRSLQIPRADLPAFEKVGFRLETEDRRSGGRNIRGNRGSFGGNRDRESRGVKRDSFGNVIGGSSQERPQHRHMQRQGNHARHRSSSPNFSSGERRPANDERTLEQKREEFKKKRQQKSE